MLSRGQYKCSDRDLEKNQWFRPIGEAPYGVNCALAAARGPNPGALTSYLNMWQHWKDDHSDLSKQYMNHRDDQTARHLVHFAAERNDLKMIKELLDDNPQVVDMVDLDRNTPLHLAVSKRVVQKLIGSGAMHKAKNSWGAVPWATVPFMRNIPENDNAFEELMNTAHHEVAQWKEMPM